MPQGIGVLPIDELPVSMLHEEGYGQLINYHREATMAMNSNSVSTFNLPHGSGSGHEQPGPSIRLTLVNSNSDCHARQRNILSILDIVWLFGGSKVHRHLKDTLDKF